MSDANVFNVLTGHVFVLHGAGQDQRRPEFVMCSPRGVP